MNQMKLDDYTPPAPHVAGSETSREAAIKIEPVAGTIRRRVLDYMRTLCSYDIGATDQMMQQDLHLDASTRRPRRVELVQGGWVRDSGRKRKTRSGRMAVIWELT